MSKKGLSFEEKRKRLLDLFYETQDFFQLKELEKIAPKRKGIVMQSVKEVLQSLVDDNLVVAEKIGTSNYFWSFPSQATHTRTEKIKQLKNEYNQQMEKKKETEEQISNAQNGKEYSKERADLIEALKAEEIRKKELLSELKTFQDCDPALIEAKKKGSQSAKEAGNRWTEHIFSIQSYCNSQFFIERNAFNQQFGIPEDFDTMASTNL